MKIAISLLTSALLLASTHDPSRDSKPISSAAEDDAASDQAAVRSSFLLRLRELATRGNLFEPDSVAQILDMKLRATPAPGRSPEACGDGTMKSGEVTTVLPQAPTWFRTLPSGAGHIDVPAFMINPATRTGDPTIEYRVYHSVHCVDWPRMRDHKEASISFNGLPAFSCLTPENIARELPAIRPVPATDGVFIMHFGGRVDDEEAVTLSFYFRAGAACALSAEIRQDQEDGYRYRRAIQKYEECRKPSDREFCARHPNVTWSDRQLRREMVLQAYERCGTVNTFYLKEPRTGEPPPQNRNEPVHRQSPCDGL